MESRRGRKEEEEEEEAYIYLSASLASSRGYARCMAHEHPAIVDGAGSLGWYGSDR